MHIFSISTCLSLEKKTESASRNARQTARGGEGFRRKKKNRFYVCSPFPRRTRNKPFFNFSAAESGIVRTYVCLGTSILFSRHRVGKELKKKKFIFRDELLLRRVGVPWRRRKNTIEVGRGEAAERAPHLVREFTLARFGHTRREGKITRHRTAVISSRLTLSAPRPT